jgi:hypothetical protein
VPAIDTFSADQVALGRAIEEIKAAWACQKHGSVCFITKEATHIELNQFHLGAFGAAIVCFCFVHLPICFDAISDRLLESVLPLGPLLLS